MSTSPLSGKPIRAVLFDYGMVLSGPPFQPAWERLRDVFGADEDNFSSAYWRFRHDYDRGALNSQSYWDAVAGELHTSLDEAQLHDLVAADIELWAQPNHQMIAWAGALQRAGIKTGILSNIGDAMEDGLIAQLEWLQGFEHHTFSHRLGTAKPDLAIYRHSAAGLGVPPEEILFIDDREENVAAAVEAGMQAIQYTKHDAFLKTMRERGLGYLLDV